jgi:hypothetical protein
VSKERSDFDRELMALEAELKRLEAEYNMFFAGRAPRLPWEQRKRLDALMKRFDRMHIQNTGDRFRFQTIQARWAAFSELWERQLKMQEQGRLHVRGGRGPASTPVQANLAPPAAAGQPVPSRGKASKESSKQAPAAAPRDAVVAATTLSDPVSQEDRVKGLYQQLAAARKEAGEKPIEYDRFAALVRAQVDKHGGGGREVAFRVDLKDGKVKLTAKTAGDS